MSKSYQALEYVMFGMLAVDDLMQGTARFKSLTAIKCISFFLTWGKSRGNGDVSARKVLDSARGALTLLSEASPLVEDHYGL